MELSMTRSQQLCEAMKSFAAEVYNRERGNTCANTLYGTPRLAALFDAGSDEERHLLADYVKTALKRERRRAAARSATYDLDRHITLFLAAKALETGQNKNGS